MQQQGCNSCASLAGVVLSFIVCFILLVIQSYLNSDEHAGTETVPNPYAQLLLSYKSIADYMQRFDQGFLPFIFIQTPNEHMVSRMPMPKSRDVWREGERVLCSIPQWHSNSFSQLYNKYITLLEM